LEFVVELVVEEVGAGDAGGDGGTMYVNDSARNVGYAPHLGEVLSEFVADEEYVLFSLGKGEFEFVADALTIQFEGIWYCSAISCTSILRKQSQKLGFGDIASQEYRIRN
jgi:hypothetical protein